MSRASDRNRARRLGRAWGEAHAWGGPLLYGSRSCPFAQMHLRASWHRAAYRARIDRQRRDFVASARPFVDALGAMSAAVRGVFRNLTWSAACACDCAGCRAGEHRGCPGDGSVER